MEDVADMELNVMACLLINPKLMDKVIVEDKHFIKHQRLWQFMKAFYKKFKTFDLQLMYSVCSDKYHIVNYTTWLVTIDTMPSHFDLYQKRLIEQYEESKKNKWIIDNIYKVANDLYVRNISIEAFKNRVDEICNNAEKIFRGEEK
jgi:hypothetical protein